jgi:nucleoside-diphosphate-sugar epimerase
MVLILGLGFTGERLARRLLRRGIPVSAAVRGIDRFRDLAHQGLQLSELVLDRPEIMLLPRNAIITILIPPVPGLRTTVQKLAPKRVIYVSSTGVYGDQADVNAETLPKPNDERGRRRVEEERWVASGPWTSLILRAAGIYGPGRGVHAALREGKILRSLDSGIVSRIHVEDLAAIIEAGIFSNAEGAWPVADDMPCATAEIISWCAEFLNLKEDTHRRPGIPRSISGRRVDGRKIREMLGVELKYPSWQAGIEASLAEENTEEAVKLSDLRRKKTGWKML